MISDIFSCSYHSLEIDKNILKILGFGLHYPNNFLEEKCVLLFIFCGFVKMSWIDYDSQGFPLCNSMLIVGMELMVMVIIKKIGVLSMGEYMHMGVYVNESSG